ncbi:MAG: histidinol dehydrogenase [Coriobacteriales bacterium]|nr:histidinol dehydrogenase [Coriobacteriales bacterium]
MSLIRRVTVPEGERFQESQINRLGAFDARALKSATDIVAAVRERGDQAIKEFTKKFDGIDLDELKVPQEQLDSACDKVDPQFLAAIKKAAANIRGFHQRQLTQSWFTTGECGQITGAKVTPLARVGVYVPGGRAQYPSTVLMDVIPAKVAGVPQVIMCAPPTKDGDISPYTLAAAKVAGVDAIYRVGGAQAIAAMAYGTESVPRVDKVVGPGNAYVAAAKKVVSGDVGIDMIAGPSEVLVLADDTSDPELVAIDLMAQAEHDPMASCYLVTTCEELVDEVEEHIEQILTQSTRADITRASLENRGLVVVCADRATAVEAANIIAPEHLEVHMEAPNELLGFIKNAGAIFLGPWTPESVGDYVAGPNHTLPTGGTARFSSPLNVEDFIKRTSIIQYSYAALDADADAITTIANAEGLWSHARAVTLRQERQQAMIEAMAGGVDGDGAVQEGEAR